MFFGVVCFHLRKLLGREWQVCGDTGDGNLIGRSWEVVKCANTKSLYNVIYISLYLEYSRVMPTGPKSTKHSVPLNQNRPNIVRVVIVCALCCHKVCHRESWCRSFHRALSSVMFDGGTQCVNLCCLLSSGPSHWQDPGPGPFPGDGWIRLLSVVVWPGMPHGDDRAFWGGLPTLKQVEKYIVPRKNLPIQQHASIVLPSVCPRSTPRS